MGLYSTITYSKMYKSQTYNLVNFNKHLHPLLSTPRYRTCPPLQNSAIQKKCNVSHTENVNISSSHILKVVRSRKLLN